MAETERNRVLNSLGIQSARHTPRCSSQGGQAPPGPWGAAEGGTRSTEECFERCLAPPQDCNPVKAGRASLNLGKRLSLDLPVKVTGSGHAARMPLKSSG